MSAAAEARLPEGWPFAPDPARDAWALAQAQAAPPLTPEQVRRIAPLIRSTASTARTAS